MGLNDVTTLIIICYSTVLYLIRISGPAGVEGVTAGGRRGLQALRWPKGLVGVK